jgi:plastocyanin
MARSLTPTPSIVLALALGACSASTPATDAGPVATDAGPTGTDTGASADAGGVPALHGCAEADFIDLRAGTPDDRMIMVPTGTLMFDFPCITISAGQAVMFMWDFALHPLAPGVAPGRTGTGTEPSPIVAQSTGMLYEPVFPTAGDYPFYCTLHHAGAMVGVVRVLP